MTRAKLVLLTLVMSGALAAVGAQEPAKLKEPKEQQPCPNKTKVFALEPEAVEAKVKELETEGYCINKSNFLVVGKQVLLIVGIDDVYVEVDECDSGEECE